jgi:hypothetical protein
VPFLQDCSGLTDGLGAAAVDVELEDAPDNPGAVLVNFEVISIGPSIPVRWLTRGAG